MDSMQDCIFCKIVRGELPSKKIYEDDDILAFLDINPANKGHVLVTSKEHYEDIFSVDEELLKKMIIVVKLLAERIKSKTGCDGVNVMQNNGKQAGQLVNHIHFHIIPRFHGDKVLITYQRLQLTEEELNEIQNQLKSEEPKRVEMSGLNFY
jgi:histidine triad (HIT) family protein